MPFQKKKISALNLILINRPFPFPKCKKTKQRGKERKKRERKERRGEGEGEEEREGKENIHMGILRADNLLDAWSRKGVQNL